MPIKIFNLNGFRIKEIKDSKDNTIFIDSYYDNNLSKYYLITGNHGSVKSYDYENNKLYFNYCDDEDSKYYHYSIIIKDNNYYINLIESSENGIIRIWNFHTGKLLKKIYHYKSYEIYSICLWDKDYIFFGAGEGEIELLELEKENFLKKCKKKHSDSVLTIKTIVHPEFGDCFISFSRDKTIKLWKIKKYELINNILMSK